MTKQNSLTPRNLLFGAGLLLLGGCATVPSAAPIWPYPEPPQQEYGQTSGPAAGPDESPQRTEDVVYAPPPGTSPPSQMAVKSNHPAVQALIDQSEGERAIGDLDRAAATLERAIRIASNDPVPWLKLAELRFELGNLIQAENLARRSLSFAASGPSARLAWRLIADIKALQGDAVAARQAREKAEQI